MLTVHLLGPVEVRRDGEPIDLGGPQPRAVVAHLALDAGRVVSVERLIDRLWGDEPPSTPLGTLQSYISRLRRAVEPARTAGAAPQVLVSEAPGYVLRIPPERIDVHRFSDLVAEGRRRAEVGDAVAALRDFDEALGLWRGPALAGLGSDDHVRSIVVRLDEERQAAIEDRFDTLLVLGRAAETVPALQAAVDEQPLRERLWGLLALALYRSGRQADALRALSAARERLLDELGLDPGPALRQLEAQILAHDPSLAAAHVSAAPAMVVSTERPAVPQVELVGRRREWQALTDALTAAAEGTSQLVLIEGEPGIGKSTLCEGFLAHAAEAGWQTAVGRCVESGLAPSLWPCIEIVRSMVEHAPAAETAPHENPLRSFVAGAGTGGALSPVEMAQHFVALVDELGATPWVLLVDDLHWADRATLDVMRLVLERVGSRPVLVLGAHRPPDLVPDSLLGEALGSLHRASSTTRIQMSPLGAGEVARLMEITTGVAPSGEMAEQVRTRAGGNPLFVAELARLAGEHGVTDATAVPDAIRDVVRERLARLPERATAELQVAAVLGERFDLRTAMAASERDADACLDALDAAIVTRILVPDADGFRFAHALVRDAVLAELTPLRLGRLHQRAAEAILAVHGDGPDQAEPIAHHRLAAASLIDPIVVARAAVRAADVARWRSALDNADRFANQALELIAAVPRTHDVLLVEANALEALISSAMRRQDPDRIRHVVDQIGDWAERTGSEPAKGLHLFLTWGPVDTTDDLRSLTGGADRARQLAASVTDPYAIVASRYVLAAYGFLTGRLAEAAEHVDIAIRASGADPDQPPEHVPLILLPVVAGLVAALRGDEQAALDHTYRRASAWLAQRSRVDPSASTDLAFNRALVQAVLDRPAEVLEVMRHRDPSQTGKYIGHEDSICDVLQGWARARLGDADGVREAEAGMDGVGRSPERSLEACMRAFLADACLAHDDPRAVELLATAYDEATSRAELFWLPEILRLQAVADRRFGDGAHAAALLDQGERTATEQGAQLLVDRIRLTRAAEPVPAPGVRATRARRAR